jgi:ribosomal-protein-alanine N-acetyltransferase
MFDKFPEFEFADFILREIRPSDGRAFFNYLHHKEVMKYVTDAELPADVAKAEAELLYWTNLYRAGTSVYWGAADRKNDTLIGTCGFNYWNKEHNRIEISYDLDYNYWGRGIATRMVKAVTELALSDKIGAQRIQATVVTDNERSIRLLERCGYKREGLLAKYTMLHGAILNSYMYARTS